MITFRVGLPMNQKHTEAEVTLKMTNRQVLGTLESLNQVKAAMGHLSDPLELLCDALRDHLVS